MSTELEQNLAATRERLQQCMRKAVDDPSHADFWTQRAEAGEQEIAALEQQGSLLLQIFLSAQQQQQQQQQQQPTGERTRQESDRSRKLQASNLCESPEGLKTYFLCLAGDNVRHANLQAAVQLITNQLEALQTALKRSDSHGSKPTSTRSSISCCYNK